MGSSAQISLVSGRPVILRKLLKNKKKFHFKIKQNKRKVRERNRLVFYCLIYSREPAQELAAILDFSKGSIHYFEAAIPTGQTWMKYDC